MNKKIYLIIDILLLAAILILGWNVQKKEPGESLGASPLKISSNATSTLPGSLGIGTTTPFSRLSVVGVGTASSTLVDVTNSSFQGLMRIYDSGSVAVRAGGSTLVAPVGMVALYSSTTQAVNAAATESTLYSYSAPGGMFRATGDTLYVKAAGSFAGSISTDKRLRFYFYDVLAYDSGNANITTAADWGITVWCVKVTVSAAKCNGSLTTTTGTTATYDDFTSITGLTFSNAGTMKLTGEGTNASDVVGQMIKMHWEPGENQ